MSWYGIREEKLMMLDLDSDESVREDINGLLNIIPILLTLPFRELEKRRKTPKVNKIMKWTFRSDADHKLGDQVGKRLERLPRIANGR